MFESVEKRLECVFSQRISLLKIKNFVYALLYTCRASILSECQTPFFHAYVLSESSLFIYQDRFILITCGMTPLYRSLIWVTNIFNESDILAILYTRRNFYFPQLQESDFEKTILDVFHCLGGQVSCIGHRNDLHMHYYLYSQKKRLKPFSYQFELLMEKCSRDSLLKLDSLGMEFFLKKMSCYEDFYKMQEYYFTPHGYSANVIFKDASYWAIHSSPEEELRYLSMSSNTYCYQMVDIHQMIGYFQPFCFVLSTFQDPIFKKDKFENDFRLFFPNYEIKEVKQEEMLSYSMLTYICQMNEIF